MQNKLKRMPNNRGKIQSIKTVESRVLELPNKSIQKYVNK